MTYHGSCHCGRIAFEVDGEIDEVKDCNCSMCQRRGGLLWFVPRASLRLSTPDDAYATYTFSSQQLRHRFCPSCGIAPFSEGRKGMAAINVRCLVDIDLSTLTVVQVDGRSF